MPHCRNLRISIFRFAKLHLFQGFLELRCVMHEVIGKTLNSNRARMRLPTLQGMLAALQAPSAHVA